MKSQEGIKKIEEFLDGLTFGKTLLGANQADVYACLKDVSAMYEDVIVDITQENEQKITELQQTLADKDARIEELTRQLAEKPEAGSRKEDEQMIASLQARIKAGAAYEMDYKRKVEILTRGLADLQKEKDERIARADREARLIVAQAKEDAAAIAEQAQIKRQQSESAWQETERARSNMLKGMQLIVSELTAMVDEVAGVQSRIGALSDKEAKPGWPQMVETPYAKKELGGSL